ncbi:MAG: PilZ domain-containing protein [Nitrospirota bacterium]|nr:PilZ domain-containing protein [Nitrospirota bacterium]
MALVDTSIISDAKTIRELFAEASTSRCLMQIDIEQKPEVKPVVRLLEVDEPNIILVEPLKAEEADDILSADDVVISFVLKAKKYMFMARIMGVVTEGLAGIRLSYPHSMQKIELRSYYRVSLNEDDVITVQLSSGDFPDTPTEGKILDISEGGLRCEILSLPEGIENGSSVSFLQLPLRRGYILSTSGTVKRLAQFKKETGQNAWLCGIEFAPLERAERNALVEFIIEKQRSEIRKRKEFFD